MDKFNNDFFGARGQIKTNFGLVQIYRLDRLEENGVGKISTLPYSIRVILEAVLRNCDNKIVSQDDVINLAQWDAVDFKSNEIPYK